MIRVNFEFNPQDCWVGLFWKRSTFEQVIEHEGDVCLQTCSQLDLWICLLPCLPLHILIRFGETVEPIKCVIPWGSNPVRNLKNHLPNGPIELKRPSHGTV